MDELNGWVKCSDRLPETLLQVLVYEYLKPMQICHIENTTLGPFWYDAYEYPSDGEFTHWKPLPDPPKYLKKGP